MHLIAAFRFSHGVRVKMGSLAMVTAWVMTNPNSLNPWSPNALETLLVAALTQQPLLQVESYTAGALGNMDALVWGTPRRNLNQNSWRRCLDKGLFRYHLIQLSSLCDYDFSTYSLYTKRRSDLYKNKFLKYAKIILNIAPKKKYISDIDIDLKIQEIVRWNIRWSCQGAWM